MLNMRLKQVILSVSDDIDETDLVDQVEGVVEAMREEIVARDEEVEKAQNMDLDAKKVELEQTIEVLKSENESLWAQTPKVELDNSDEMRPTQMVDKLNKVEKKC